MINPDDAERLGLQPGARAGIQSRVGKCQVEVDISDRIMPGVVSLPHGFGHHYQDSQQSIARDKLPGVSASDLVDDNLLDMPSGTSVVNGVAVKVFSV